MSHEDYKERVRKAAEAASAKALKEYAAPTRHNGKPEKEVEKSCLVLMRSWGWSVQIIESKATYNPVHGRWISQSAKQGTPDCLGVTNTGVAVAVEFKAPGKLSTLRENQRDFLIERIKQYSFAVVVDSPELLKEIRKAWEFLRSHGNMDASKDYLLSVVVRK
jgi:hypothetical protein